MGDEAITLYAQWSDNPTFTVTYDGNNADRGEAPEDTNRYEEGDTVTVAGNGGSLAKPGNTFTGWNTQAEGEGGTAYTPGAIFVIGTKNVTLYARWTTKPTYTITYLGNGNTAGTAPGAVSNEAGVEITIAGQGTLVKKGHSFIGWNTAADGSGKTYAPNASYTIDARNETLNAQWEINTYTITYDGNGDNVKDVPQATTHSYNTETTLTTETPTHTGYTFYRWNTSPSGDGEDYQPKDKFTISDRNVTLYARWTVNSYRLIYNANGGGGTIPAEAEVPYGDSVTVAPQGSLIRTGWSFTGWNTATDGSGTERAPVTKFAMGAEDDTLYAQWTIIDYSITYHLNGGVNGANPSSYTVASATIMLADASRNGYDFGGWYTNSEFTGTAVKIIPSGSTGDKEFWAKWTAIMCTITFDGQGATLSPSPASMDIAQSSALGSLPTEPKKTSYVFDGWFTGTNGTGSRITAATTFSVSTTVYAKWIIKDADNNIYSEVRIGNQVWMVENLMVTHYRGGTSIPYVPDNEAWGSLSTPGYCWYDNSEAVNKIPYGALYNSYVIKSGKLAPEGWHVPSDEEWTILTDYLGGVEIAGGSLKEEGTLRWSIPNTGAINISGFTALPGGCRTYEQYGAFYRYKNEYGYWWSSTAIIEGMEGLHDRNLGYDRTAVYDSHAHPKGGMSVRCVRDY